MTGGQKGESRDVGGDMIECGWVYPDGSTCEHLAPGAMSGPRQALIVHQFYVHGNTT